MDKRDIAAVRAYGEERFLEEIRADLLAEGYRADAVRRVHIPKAGQPGKTRPLGIPTIRDRVVQMAVKIVIEPLFEADFQPCSYGFRPKRTARMALNGLVEGLNRGQRWVVDVDLQSYFDTIDHGLLMRLVERRVADRRVLGLIRAWLRAGVLEEGKITHPERGTPQGGVISPLLANLFLNEVDRWWVQEMSEQTTLIRYADDMVLLTRTKREAEGAWKALQERFAALRLTVNRDKSRLAHVDEGFAFLGFEFRARRGRVHLWPRSKAVSHIKTRIREAMREISSQQPLGALLKRLNPILNGWCTYFRVGNSNRVFHEVDRAARDAVHLWLRRKHRITWAAARARWTYRLLHEKAKLYRMVGKVSHLEALG